MIGVIEDNAYRLLSMPEISAVLTVNSGLAYEAPYFGKHVHALAPLPVRIAWRGVAPDSGSHASLNDVVLMHASLNDVVLMHASLNDVVLTPDFWRTVLAPHVRVSPADGMRLSPKPNRLRIALDSFWNYQEIDTDRIPPRPG